MKYAYENGCPWNDETCTKASNNGHLECLKYAHENSFPWDKMTCVYASENKHLECLNYAFYNGCACPNDEQIYRKLEINDSLDDFISKGEGIHRVYYRYVNGNLEYSNFPFENA